MKKFVTVLAFLFVACSAFAQRIISPVPGTWANKQCLVLNTTDGSECFYSYSGTDPLTSGFAYDGPVLIDETGDVTVRVVSVKGDQKEELSVTYTVKEVENPYPAETVENAFVSKMCENPLLVYSFGTAIQIPEKMLYALGDGAKPFMSGSVLSLSSANRLSRYLPCTVTNGNSRWRFVIFVSAGEAGVLAKKDVPFEINGWNEFIWKGEKLIYCIDNGMWSADTNPAYLDRSVPHVVRWQNVAYEKGNPVQSFLLPAMPVIETRAVKKGKGPVTFSIRGDSRYRMELISSGVSGELPGNVGLFSQAVFDTFDGDAIGGKALFACYCDGVYQGTLGADYSIDNQPPLMPEFVSSTHTYYARSSVDLRIYSEPGSEVFYALSNPIEVDETNMDDHDALDAIDTGNFHVYGGIPIRLKSGSDKAQFYKVRAYAADSTGNVSATSEYRVVIDEYNYYLDSSAGGLGADGSKNHPFNSFAKALEVINKGRFSRFYVSGTIDLPLSETVISSNCEFISVKDARFVIPPTASLTLQTASLSAKNCVFEKEAGDESIPSNGMFFKLENAAVSFTGCEIVGVFGQNGTAFNASSSVLDFISTGITVQSDSYACGVSSSDSKVTGRDSHFTAIAQTAVNFSVQGGLFELRSSDCKVVSHLGRIAELTRTNARITGTSYTGEFDNKVSAILPIWQDEKTLMLENSGNTTAGFN